MQSNHLQIYKFKIIVPKAKDKFHNKYYKIINKIQKLWNSITHYPNKLEFKELNLQQRNLKIFKKKRNTPILQHPSKIVHFQILTKNMIR